MRKAVFSSGRASAKCGNHFLETQNRILRFLVFELGKKPHDAVCCFFVREETAICGLPFFVWARNRILRFAVFSLGKKPQFAVCHFFVREKTAKCGKTIFKIENRMMRFGVRSYVYVHMLTVAEGGSGAQKLALRKLGVLLDGLN